MYKKYIKRVLDIILSLVGLIFLSPLLLIISLLIIIIDRNKIIYKQKRNGKDGKVFDIYKFSTFKKNEVTRLGGILRTLSIDELPQFINILKGDMSFIGPRPWMLDYYKVMNSEQKKRYNVRPGLTGLAQVNGRNSISIFDKINYDLEYVNTISFLVDLKIIFKSIRIIVYKEESSDINNTIKNEIEELKKYSSNKTDYNNLS